jgi:hypothetical protein
VRNTERGALAEIQDGAQGTEAVQQAALLRLAHATIGLSQVAPRLSELAGMRQSEAEHQAERARNVTRLAQEISDALGQTVGMLRVSSVEIGELTQLIRRIADETSLIAINTGVAAARAGSEGKVFSVLANEIRQLSDNTAAAARDVESRIRRLQESADRTAQVVGLGRQGAGPARADGMGLAWLLQRMNEAEASASRQAMEARELTSLGLRLRGLAEEMIGSVGAFRLDAHRRAEGLVAELRTDPGLCSGEPARQERALRGAVDRCAFIELAYATDGRGIQTTRNVAPRGFQARYGESGAQRDWSTRPWFRGAMRSGSTFTSEIYRSAATDEFCLTVSAPFVLRSGGVRGVVALDINFRQILGDA